MPAIIRNLKNSQAQLAISARVSHAEMAWDLHGGARRSEIACLDSSCLGNGCSSNDCSDSDREGGKFH